MMGPGLKYDDDKTPLDLLPLGALFEVGKVLGYGARKYGANNWQNVAPKRRYLAAAFRHLFARARGERIDPESGLPHLAHAACSVLFLLSHETGHDPVDAFDDIAVEHEEPVSVAALDAAAAAFLPPSWDLSRDELDDSHDASLAAETLRPRCEISDCEKHHMTDCPVPYWHYVPSCGAGP